MRFPTGGKVRERKLIRCDSVTDSIVWMGEDGCVFIRPALFMGEYYFRGRMEMTPYEHKTNMNGMNAANHADLKATDSGRLRTMKLTFTALFTALAILLNYFPEIPIPLPFAPWLKLDFSYVPMLMLSFLMGPLSGVLALFITNAVHLLQSNTFGVGQLANVLMGLCFLLPPSLMYRRERVRNSAFVGSLVGIVLMTVVGVFVNKYILVPAFMGEKIAKFPMTGYLLQAIIPFNLIKGSVNVAITFLIYKRLSKEIHKLEKRYFHN